jgi:hypothetical protein
MAIEASSISIVPDSVYRFEMELSRPLLHTREMIIRDHQAVFGQAPSDHRSEGSESVVVFRYATEEDHCPDWPEAFCFRFISREGIPELHIIGRDELGCVYGLLHYSRHHLGVDPFWYWADLPPVRRQIVSIPANSYDSMPTVVKFRGWFVNDEVCLIGWKEQYPPSEEVWQPVFEALLRCGGNMVIPGTDLPKDGVHHDLAADMGLWVTHHHAEPLGAEMFLRAYPGKQASYKDYPELFEQLWREAIHKQRDKRIVWVLSFRGQGDKPFWENDPSFDTPEKRGAMIARVVQKQYEMILESALNPVCCMALYGEIAELYKAGHIPIPPGIIKIWADNGYGKMVSRRHGNLNLRIPALPSAHDDGKHGLYYHVTFHDLQASNHLTLFPVSTDLIYEELEKAFDAGAHEYLLLNCGNIRQHLLTLDLVARCWGEGTEGAENDLVDFVYRMFSTEQEGIVSLFNSYFSSTIAYGPNKDDRAGDEFYHHPARQMIGHWLKAKSKESCEQLHWATGNVSFYEQIQWFKGKLEASIPKWSELKQACLLIISRLPDPERIRLQDQLLFHIDIHLSGCKGFVSLCNAFEAYDKENFALAFVLASQSLWAYTEGTKALKAAEHGKWNNFYSADWLTNIANTIDHVDTLRRYLRIQGDSPDMFLWYKEFLMPETEKHIYLENTHRNPLGNDELALKLLHQFSVEDNGVLLVGE